MGIPNNINLVIAFQNDEKIDDNRIKAQVLTKESIDNYVEQLYKNLKKEIKDADAKILIISSEHLTSRLKHDY